MLKPICCDTKKEGYLKKAGAACTASNFLPDVDYWEAKCKMKAANWQKRVLFNSSAMRIFTFYENRNIIMISKAGVPREIVAKAPLLIWVRWDDSGISRPKYHDTIRSCCRPVSTSSPTPGWSSPSPMARRWVFAPNYFPR